MKKISTSYYGMALILVGLLGGCQTPQPDVDQISEKPYTLQHDEKKLSLHFSSQHHKLPMDEKARLLSGINPKGPGKYSTHMTIPSTGSLLGKQHLKEIIRIALKAGMKAKQIHRSDDLRSAKGNEIEVILDTYRAIPPLCPNWQTQYGSAYERGRTSNFGCSTAHNFLLMIEDPIVLFKGEKSVSRDAASDSLAIADHHAGKDRGKWLKNDKSSSGSAGSSSDSSSSKD